MTTAAENQGLMLDARDAARWAEVHVPRDRQALREVAEAELSELLPGHDLAVLVNEDDEQLFRVEMARGSGCPLQAGAEVTTDSWSPADAVRLPLRYGRYVVGQLIVGPAPGPAIVQRLELFVRHFSNALVNIRLSESERQTADAYRASLQAYEQGVALFQEQNADALSARFLGLCMSVLGCDAGATYILTEIGQGSSNLELDQCLGLPEEILDELLDEDGGWWPKSLVAARVTFLERGENGSFAGLADDRLPAAVENVVGAPLSYHGVDVGVCLFFNVQANAASIEHTRRLFELGAAIFHRRELEARAVHNRELETQLEIAAVLQARFMPQSAHDNDQLEFAWRSVPAQFIGGDYVDIVDGIDGNVHCVIADVSGHGVNSALLMTSFRATYRASTTLCDAAETLTRSNNNIVQEVGDTGMFLTVAAVDIRPASRSFVLSSAGHNAVYVYRPGQDEFFELGASGPPMGIFGGMDYGREEFSYESGDYLVLYTDGVVEAATEDDTNMFGDERLMAVVRECAAAGPEPMLETLYAEVQKFTGRERETDDVSVLIARFK